MIYGVTFPGLPSAPLLRPTSSSGNEENKYPLVLFSPGVGTSRLMYSAICSEIASRGYVVAALEHRDGTSPASTVLLPNGETRTISWLQWSDLQSVQVITVEYLLLIRPIAGLRLKNNQKTIRTFVMYSCKCELQS